MTPMDGEFIERYEEALATGLPLLAASLTWVKVNGGHTTASMSDWEEDRAPHIGETVLVSDGGPFLRAKIQDILPDGDIPLLVPRYARKPASVVA